MNNEWEALEEFIVFAREHHWGQPVEWRHDPDRPPGAQILTVGGDPDTWVSWADGSFTVRDYSRGRLLSEDVVTNSVEALDKYLMFTLEGGFRQYVGLPQLRFGLVPEVRPGRFGEYDVSEADGILVIRWNEHGTEKFFRSGDYHARYFMLGARYSPAEVREAVMRVDGSPVFGSVPPWTRGSEQPTVNWLELLERSGNV
ncbi:hypothetical protein [Microbacterium gorillae]|uniref:hypothetical protein n=1 Tax=Microbacterium gorillae TaxID=1231063 RepID=UPI003D95BFDB